MKVQPRRGLPASKQIAYTAIMCALLIAAQYVFSFVSGVEIVTVLFVCFAFTFGIKLGVTLAVCFSLLRCAIFGFYPNVAVLYIVYYPLLAAAFGALGKIKPQTFESFPLYFLIIVNVLLAAIAAACAALYFLNIIKISRLLVQTVNVFLWLIFGLCAALLIVFNSLFVAKRVFKKNTSPALKLIFLVTVAALFTVFFTLLDDVLTPLMLGWPSDSALAYFYSSFAAMLPQTVCTVFTVGLLFFPLTAALRRFCK